MIYHIVLSNHHRVIRAHQMVIRAHHYGDQYSPFGDQYSPFGDQYSPNHIHIRSKNNITVPITIKIISVKHIDVH